MIVHLRASSYHLESVCYPPYDSLTTSLGLSSLLCSKRALYLQLVWRAMPVLSKRDLKQLELYKQYAEGILKIRDGKANPPNEAWFGIKVTASPLCSSNQYLQSNLAPF